eukprot:8490512-Pyramimonas_sp.AAC.1
MQWIGDDPREARILHTCVRKFALDASTLGLVLQNGKSGYAATTIRASRGFAYGVRCMKLRSKKHIRNLGHDLYG